MTNRELYGETDPTASRYVKMKSILCASIAVVCIQKATNTARILETCAIAVTVTCLGSVLQNKDCKFLQK